jgi:alpha,alpha-trehalase
MSAPRHLLAAWPAFQSAVRRRGLALFSDFDGTLARIRRHPGQVRLAGRLRRLLAEIAGQGALVGIVSGRRLADVRARVGLGGIWYAGVHGYHLRAPGGRRYALAERRTRARLARAARRLARELGGVPGVAVEPKGATVAVHYRGASPRAAARARAAVDRVRAAQPQLHLLAGKKVWEFFPDARTDKWSAVQFILRRERAARRAVVYLGDDTTDERVFARLAGWSVAVGRRRRTAARVFLRSPAEVRQFLERTVRIAR